MATTKGLSALTTTDDPRLTFRAKRGDVKLAVLSLLNENRATGYQLMKLIREKSGDIWRISAGSIYPTLQKLADDGLVDSSYGSGAYDSYELYHITASGKKFVTENAQAIQKLWDFSNGRDVEGLTPLEFELSALNDALQIVSKSSERKLSQVASMVRDLRKRIYMTLAE